MTPILAGRHWSCNYGLFIFYHQQSILATRSGLSMKVTATGVKNNNRRHLKSIWVVC
jgi:hypothetical protein